MVVAAETLQEHKHQNVNCDERIVNEWRAGAGGVVVGYWEEHRTFL
jgi:hypothetical protein